MTGDRMNIALIGGGDWGETWSRILKTSPHVEFIGMWDHDESVRSRWETHTYVFTSLESVLKQGNVDAVIICTPPETHTKLVKIALTAGLHVLIEKPFGFHHEPVDKLFDLACHVQRCIMVNYTFLYTPAFEALRERTYGKWQEYWSLRLSPRKYLKSVHVIDDLVVHDLAILNSLHDFNDSIRVRCEMSGLESDGGMSCTNIEIDAGSIRARIMASNQWPWKRREITLRTQNGTFAYDDGDPNEPLKEFIRDGSSLIIKSVIKTGPGTGLERALSKFLSRIRSCVYDKDRLLLEKVNRLRASLHESRNCLGHWVSTEL